MLEKISFCSDEVSLDQFAIACTGKWRDLRYGTGSGSDLAPPGAATREAPGRYRSLYRTGAVPYTHMQTAIVVKTRLLKSSCPSRGRQSDKTHSRYRRRLASGKRAA